MNERLRELQEQLAPLLDHLRDRWDDLGEQQKRGLRLAAKILAALLPLLLVVLPLAGARLAAYRALAEAEAQLQEMRALERIVLERGLNATAQAAETPDARGGSLLRTVDGIARKLGINELIQAMRPLGKDGGGDAVEIQLKGLVLAELVELLYQLEVNPGGVTVRRLDVVKNVQDPRVVRATLELTR